MKAVYLKDNNNNKVVTVPYYRVGDLFLTTIATNPSNFLGGTWELFGPGRVPVCVDTSDINFNTVKKTGGNKEHYHTTGNFTLDYKHLPLEVCIDGNFGYLSGAAKTGVSGWQITSLRDYGQYGYNQPHNHGNTGTVSNFQPYITCYVWIRTA